MGAGILRWEGLSVRYAGAHAGAPATQAVRDLSFELAAGECLAIVGESGSGKTQSMLAPFGLAAGAELSGRAWFEGVDLVSASEPQRNALRGTRVGFVFQDPLTSLAPHLRIGEQLTEGIRYHCRADRATADRHACHLLELVQLTEPQQRLRQYPHELSGGMRQRIVIAMALACEPCLLVADEPTTALDATVQAEILSLLRRLQQERGMALVFISHDLGAVARVADRVLVLNKGVSVENGPAAQVLRWPVHSYTRDLARAARSESGPPVASSELGAEASPAIVCESVSVSFKAPRLSWWRGRPRPTTDAVKEVSFKLARGRALGIVGESGSGKSTLLRAAVGLQAFRGSVFWGGRSLGSPSRLPLERRLDVQMVFQDALASLDPSKPVGTSVALAVRQRHPSLDRAQAQARVDALLQACGLDPELGLRHPTQLSGGQNQRAAIARALGTEPVVLACDEAVSALDMTVRNQVLDLLGRLRCEMGLAVLFVTHDIGVVKRLCDDVVVMHRGRVVEAGMTRQVLGDPRDPYTRTLLDAVLELPPEEVE